MEKGHKCPQIMEIVNQAQVKINEINVPNPQEETAHISKFRLTKSLENKT